MDIIDETFIDDYFACYRRILSQEDVEKNLGKGHQIFLYVLHKVHLNLIYEAYANHFVLLLLVGLTY